jgi:hypothetical protein
MAARGSGLRLAIESLEDLRLLTAMSASVAAGDDDAATPFTDFTQPGPMR